jgi:DNA-binding protein WhiA
MDTKTQSFASLVKEEVARLLLKEEDEAKKSFLSSFVKINGHIKISDGAETLDLASESAAIAKSVYEAISSLYGVPVRFAYTRSAGFLKRVVYHVVVDQHGQDILDDLGIDLLEGKLPKYSYATPELAAAYLAGAFLASGSVNDPKSTNYHLEMALLDGSYAKWLSHLINQVANHRFQSKIVERRNQYVVYLKRSDEIADFLILIGAKENCLKFENVRVDRDFANVDNRLQNLDGANMGKTVKAAERQKKEIQYFVDTLGYDRIDNPKLKALMKLRLAHEDASLEELAKLLSEELNTEITKSNINHLFRYLDSEYKKATYARK